MTKKMALDVTPLPSPPTVFGVFCVCGDIDATVAYMDAVAPLTPEDAKAQAKQYHEMPPLLWWIPVAAALDRQRENAARADATVTVYDENGAPVDDAVA